MPSCECISGYQGNPFHGCHLIPIRIEPTQPHDPCHPSPCGPFSQCRNINGSPLCSCLENYLGPPPSCRPECVISSECPLDKACVSQRCSDPCLREPCAPRAVCKVLNHSPICSCPPNHVGNPFVSCELEQIKKIETDPCHPSPCGPNSECRNINGFAACSCQRSFVGSPPNCRPECSINEDCPSDKSCSNYHCVDPCRGACGVNAECRALNHQAVCTCAVGYDGDAYSSCRQIPKYLPPPPDQVQDPCNPSPCGTNALCSARNGAGSCVCQELYFGDPYVGCRPECVQNNDCPTTKACSQNKCIGKKNIYAFKFTNKLLLIKKINIISRSMYRPVRLQCRMLRQQPCRYVPLHQSIYRRSFPWLY